MNNSSQLKFLQGRVASLRAEINAYNSEKQSLDERIAVARKNLKSLESEIFGLSSKELVVSEHALLRYCERVMGIDFDKIAAEILERTKTIYDILGDGEYPINNSGGCVKIVKGVVVTTWVVPGFEAAKRNLVQPLAKQETTA